MIKRDSEKAFNYLKKAQACAKNSGNQDAIEQSHIMELGLKYCLAEENK